MAGSHAEVPMLTLATVIQRKRTNAARLQGSHCVKIGEDTLIILDTLGHLDVHPSATKNDLCVHVII
jgi:hypothetical protein